jgi:predicted ATP-grasp superfamily ATP-dependent carboligase
MASIIYITRDIERALGKTPGSDYFIITNKNTYSESIKSLFPESVFLIDSADILDTHELLENKEVEKIIKNNRADIVVFKNTIQIEKICKEKGWVLLNPSAELAEKIENKITQISWLGELNSLLPDHKIIQVKDIEWNKKSFILQWSHGHTGDGTLLISNEKDLIVLKEKFPLREARTTDFIKGPMFTVNIVVNDKENLIGNISYQITGMLPFTENAFSTIGNDWSVPQTILSENHLQRLEEISQLVANKMRSAGWKGLFGIDVIYDEERDMMHLIEINARQPASTTLESLLQININIPGITIFDAHLKALTNTKIDQSLIPINDGAQILQRVTSQTKKINSKKLIDAGYRIIEYKNNKMNADLCRIQSNLGIMETHNKLNKRGKEILELLD